MPAPDEALDERTTVRETQVERVIGRMGRPEDGNTLLVVAGIHGNEAAGLHAGRRLIERLESLELPLAGELVVLAGNRKALSRKQRFLSRDLNRGWNARRLDALRDADSITDPEDEEQLELLAEINAVIDRSKGAVYFLDLHTTSSDGYPFAMIMDGAPQRHFAYNFPLPLILGLLDQIDSVLLKYMHERGCIAFGIEGGQNEDPASIANHEAVLWIGLTAASLLPPTAPIEIGRHRATLTQACYGCPRILQVVHRHSIREEDRFRMEPGFANIERVKGGALLAHDRNGEIRAPQDGVVFLPLYQAQGDDGFFFGREVMP